MANTTALGSVRFMSWNIKGIQHPIKRNRVFTHLKSLGSDIMFLKETHLRASEHTKLKKGWIDQIFHSNYGNRSRGAAILIRKGVPFVPGSVTPDNNGRFVIVTGKLYGNLVALVNLYGPNWDDPQFFSCLIGKLPDLNSHLLILGGDFNCTLQPALDKSSHRRSKSVSKSSALILSIMESYKLFDPWRHSNPTARQFSFFSPVHLSYSRIDFYLIDHRTISLVTNCQYHAIVISDHSPVQLDMSFPNNPRPQRSWQLDPLLLTNKSFQKLISNEIDLYLEINSTPGMSYATIWESLKAYLRGKIISYAAHRKRERTKRLTELTQQISDIDDELSHDFTPDLYKERLLLKTEYDNLSIKQTERLLLKTKQSYYEHGEKAGKLLCHQLRQAAARSAIPEIRVSPGSTSTHPQIINDQFKAYYEELYTSQSSMNAAETQAFLDGLELPKISTEDQASLDAPITNVEISQAISSMQSGKAPGPDGFPIEFYKLFSHKLVPILNSLFKEIISVGKLPLTMTQATISVLLKKDKDPLECGSYRPISLLCCDYKILTKVLARRLETVIPNIIDPDQTGFIPGRQSFYNMRRLFNILYSSHSTRQPEVLLSLDAEKAFDRVEWNYLFMVLDGFGFGTSLISWIKILYTSPSASVRTNQIRSSPFMLQRGTRQGCCLSPFLFDLAIEPLAVALRIQQDIPGIVRNQIIHKVSLYADDLLLYISNPAESIPKLIDVLHQFGKLSGYRLNLSKSSLFPINQLAISINYSNLPFKLEHQSFTYLGIRVTRQYKDLYDCNFKLLLERTKQDFQRWSALPVTLAGRVNTVKMTILPRFLYLFQMIPIILTKSWFKVLNSNITSFIWNNSTPRIKRAYLEMPKEAGGLGLPHFLFYYWSANISKLNYWISTHENKEGPAWASMELNSNSPLSPISIPSGPLPVSVSLQGLSPVVKNTLKIWFQFRKHFHFSQAITLLPLANNHLFPPSQIDAAFQVWHRNGLVFFGDLFVEATFASFNMLQKDHNLPNNHFFRYLQVRSFARKHFPFPSLSPKNATDIILDLDPMLKKRVSKIYKTVLGISPPQWDKARLAWEEDLGVALSDETWQCSLKRIHTTSLCLKHGLIQFKIVHRLHYSPEKLAKIYPGTNPVCPRCGHSPAKLGHMFWSCNSLNNFWVRVFEAISSICDRTVNPDPTVAIFGVFPSEEPFTVPQVNAVAFITLLARRQILLLWKSVTPPSFRHWIKEVLSVIPLEKLRYNRSNLRDRYIKTWAPFIEFVENVSFT